MEITFVTAYFPYDHSPYFKNNLAETDPHYVYDLISTGVPICIYMDSACEHRDTFFEWSRQYDNFRIMPMRLPNSYKETDLFGLLSSPENVDAILPMQRNYDKDTIEHLIWTHYRVVLLHDACRSNPFSTSQFAWVDANVAKMFRNKETTLAYLREMRLPENAEYAKSVFLPGCLSEPVAMDGDKLYGQICWRFCGCVIAGRGAPLLAFAAEYVAALERLVRVHQRITWDVNFLAYFEHATTNADEWTLDWYRADHNDDIVQIEKGLPFRFRSAPLPIARTLEYDFPIIDGYHSGSVAFVRTPDNSSIVNVRYINYMLVNEGANYMFHTDDYTIRSMNFSAILDNCSAALVGVQQMEGTVLADTAGHRMARPRGDRAKYISLGLEDIRLYIGENDELRFIATNMEYSPINGNRMMIGKYDRMGGRFFDCQSIVPPDPTSHCEKNWVPVFRRDVDRKTQFIYKWWPYQIGEIDDTHTNCQLRIHTTVWLKDPIFKSCRGSSIFVPCQRIHTRSDHKESNQAEMVRGDFLVGVVHFSVANQKGLRTYYHFLVALEKATLMPKYRTDVFHFFSESIEFAIGFDILGIETPEKYRFWVSRMDRDPIMAEVEATTVLFDRI